MIQTKKLKHSKFRNAGILFELLVKQVTSDILSSKDCSASSNMIKKYFNESTELGRELKLYKLISEETTKDRDQAEELLEIVVKTRSKINNQNLDKQKFELVKEIKDHWDINSFMKGSIGNYKLLASIYKILEESAYSNIQSDASEIYQAKNLILEHLATSTKKKSTLNEDTSKLMRIYREQTEDMRLLTYKILVENFNKKYTDLCDNQKSLIREYINNVANTTKLKDYLNNCVDDVSTKMKKILESTNDPAIKIKINETSNQISKIKECQTVKDNHMTAILLSYELIKEMSNG